MSSSPPPSGGPAQDSKAKRYDRQIRIWGTEGQQRLEASRIALLNCSPTGSETLKNLVLGGIASFTIVDGQKVEARDLGNNFLIDSSRMGRSRAQVVTDLLKEMNDSVSGSYVEDAPEDLLENHPQFLDNFDLVIATQMREQQLLKLDDLCRSKGVKLLAVRSYGLTGCMRASLPEHLVIESKPDSQVDDLRLTCPWPALQEWVNSFDLDSMDKHTHQHLPYVVLLLKALQSWRASLGPDTPSDRIPANSQERTAFKKLLSGMRKHIEDGVTLDEENFAEALKAAFHAWTRPSIPSEVRAILEDPKADNLESSTPDFWVMVAALRRFVAAEGGGRLPLDGDIPDMHATTDLYLQLQRLYREQADSEVAAVEAHLQQLIASLGSPGRNVPSALVKHFCRNARNIRVVRYRTLAEEYSNDPSVAKGSQLAAALSEEGTAPNANLYVLLRACDRFYQAHGRYPGVYDNNVEDDVPLLKAVAQQLLSEIGAGAAQVQDDFVAEMCRWVTAAFTDSMYLTQGSIQV
eukprot:GHUV01021234.1.p1 GENE.GHUV01021234.1~~GHUV01021234.1.p1  ORF type:complete len:521 (+),score=136.35 GHUV01021234.1:1712-3274(+)